MKKQITAACTAAVLLFTAVPGLAALYGISAKAEGRLEFRADDVYCTGAEDEIAVPVRMVSNPGYISGVLKFTWDTAQLELVGVDYNTAVAPANDPAPLPDLSTFDPLETPYYTLSFGDDTADRNFTETGDAFTLRFKPTEHFIPNGSAAVKTADKLWVPDVVNAALDQVECIGFQSNIRYLDSSALNLYSETVYASVHDEEIRVPVYARTNPGFISGTIDIAWENFLHLKDVEYSETLASANDPAPVNQSEGQYRLSFGDDFAETDFTGTGLLFTLVFTPDAFELSDFPETGRLAASVRINGTGADVINAQMDNLLVRASACEIILSGEMPAETTSAVITTESTVTTATVTTSASTTAAVPKKGDLNGDGKLDLKDVVLLRRAIAGGWNVTADPAAADLNGDSAVNLKDVILLRRTIAGGWDS
ncbi:MAG: dockerin type I repeat-containing protein [Oscillospiraceae bacterium]|nr:dockerin type I repeat-containing protein [Oscillospiraceae bacterium]